MHNTSERRTTMKICFPVPVSGTNNLESQVFGHFGSAPGFVIVDTTTRSICDVINRDQQHAHGACSPLRALGGQEVDAVVVGGIGNGALMGLLNAGLKVYQSRGGTIGENLALLESNHLPLLQPEQVCGGHGGGHGNGHGCGCAH
jgi:predicted Fe-Mo cluster-binding NifX family protein